MWSASMREECLVLSVKHDILFFLDNFAYVHTKLTRICARSREVKFDSQLQTEQGN